MYSFLSSCFFILMSLAPFLVTAQELELRMQRFTTEDGLSSPNLTQFFQDSRGVIWLATSYGLNRYDGSSIKNYLPADGLCHEYILEVTEDAFGNLWILGGDFGRVSVCISIFDPIEEHFYTIEEYTGAAAPFKEEYTSISPRFREVIVFHEVSNDSIRFFELHGKEIRPGFKMPAGINSIGRIEKTFKINPHTYSISGWLMIDSLSSNMGKYLFHLNEKEAKLELVPSKENWCEQIPVGDDLQIYCSNYQDIKEYYFYLNETFYGRVPTKNASGHLRNNRAYLLTNEDFRIYQKVADTSEPVLLFDMNLDSETVPSSVFSYMDNDGGLWYSSSESIIRLVAEPQFFESTLVSEGVVGSFSPIRGITASADGTLFTGSLSYLNVEESDGSIKNAFPGDGQLQYSGILGLTHSDNYLWLCMERFPLVRYDPATNETELYPIQENESKVELRLAWKPYFTSKGDLWIGAGKGLFRLDTTRNLLIPFSNYGSFEELAGSTVYDFYENDKGTWLSTSTGLYLVNLETEQVLAVYNEKQESPFYLPANHLAHLHEDEAGLFWIASKEKGLIKWNPTSGTSELFNSSNSGISHDVLYAVYEDEHDNLWLPSTHGLNCFNKSNNEVTVYQKEDGLPHNEFNTIAHFQDTAGFLYFGTQNGRIKFHPSTIRQEDKQRPFLLNSVVRINKKDESRSLITPAVLDNHQLKLRPNDKAIALNFGLINYNKKKAVRYNYQIEGYHESWKSTAEPTLLISGLPYGAYTLKLRAKANGSNLWVEYPYPIQLQVLKPYYLKWWFMGSMLLLITIGFFALLTWQNRQHRARKKALERLVMERTEKIQRQAEELKELDKMKSHFFANVSHELRTPITLMLGPVHKVLKEGEGLSQKQKSLLDVSRQSGEKLLQLVKEILDLRKLEMNKMVLDPEPTLLSNFFSRFAQQFESIAEQKQIDFRVKSAVSAALVANIDQEKFRQILVNLLSNALKFTPPGGEVEATLSLEEERVQLIVSDSGPGIPEEELTLVFDRYFQTNRTDMPAQGGTGIGLALCKEYAKLFGGQIIAKSVLGEGATFIVTFPLESVVDVQASDLNPIITPEASANPSTGQRPEQVTIASENSQKPSLLIVEDNRELQVYLQLILQEKYQVHTAEHGQEALAMLSSGTKPQLILSDYMMPVMDGFQLLKHLKSGDTTRHIPVIMLTARAELKDRLNALRIGVDDYITKPFDEEELKVRIENLLNNQLSRQVNAPDDAPGQEKLKRTFSQVDLEWLKEFEVYIQDNYTDSSLSIPDLARTFAMSQSTLLRQLKRLTGLTPAKYIQEIRLDQARQLIENGAYGSINSVAYKVGYRDMRSFSRIFKKRYGKSPSET